MKSIVLYFTKTLNPKPLIDHTAIWLGDELVGWVRAELRHQSAAVARKTAKPRKGETTLNAVELD